MYTIHGLMCLAGRHVCSLPYMENTNIILTVYFIPICLLVRLPTGFSHLQTKIKNKLLREDNDNYIIYVN